MDILRDWIRHKAEEDLPESSGKKKTVAPAIGEVYLEALDAIAERIGMTRTGLAAELLERSIIIAGREVGVGIFPTGGIVPGDIWDEAEAEHIVGLFDDPREKKE